jgi:serpin B
MSATRGWAIGAGFAMVLGVAGACGSEPVEATRLDRPVEFAGVADAGWGDDGMAQASVRLAAALVAAGEEENVVVSPLSLQLALAVLREGASGTAADQLDEVLGLPSDDPSQAVADLRALLGEFEGDVSEIDEDNPPEAPLVHIADGVFIQPGWPVGETFLERAAAYHRAQVYEADFAAGRATEVLDAWVQEETGGLLESAPAEPSRDTLLTLLDAVTFGASWLDPFDPARTDDGPFTRGDGSTVDVPMMSDELGLRYAEGSGWRAVELPYTEGFAMRLVLPDESVAPGDLTVEQWQEVAASLASAAPQPVDLTMPRWESDTNLDLTDRLDELGLGALADPQGDLDGIFVDAYVSKVAQAATITVAERGTVAAAVTQVEVGVTSAAPQPAVELVLDHPFDYQVVHVDTGLVLFAGKVGDPS